LFSVLSGHDTLPHQAPPATASYRSTYTRSPPLTYSNPPADDRVITDTNPTKTRQILPSVRSSSPQHTQASLETGASVQPHYKNPTRPDITPRGGCVAWQVPLSFTGFKAVTASVWRLIHSSRYDRVHLLVRGEDRAVRIIRLPHPAIDLVYLSPLFPNPPDSFPCAYGSQ